VLDDDARRAGLITSLGALRRRIAEAAEASGRDAASITLIAVTKTYPARDIATLAELGVRDVGESREQEARAKLAELADLPLHWHLVGRLQSNKARSVASFAYAVHSVDRPKLATALAEAVAAERERALEVFVQVSLDGDPERGGVVDNDVDALADRVAALSALRLRGVMAVPPMSADPDTAFARLAEIAARVRESHPGADSISAGMSHDLEAAVRHGSTHVRVGSALLGRRST
jgi:pyridoxal phosphate enzyme (YggS family)